MTFVSSLKRALPPALTPVAKQIYHRLFRLRLRVEIWLADLRLPASKVPIPPAILRYRVCESLSVDEFLRVGAGCARLIEQHGQAMGMDVAHPRRLLDFGCGCGRTMRWFLTSDNQLELHGVDVDREAIEWCSQNLARGSFLATPPVPPLPYADEYFDFIYCLSVFTHLNESMQDLWLADLCRVLKPGGVLLLTIYGASAAATLSVEERQILGTVGFVHKRSQKLRGLVPDWYQTSWHSPEYMQDRLAAEFEDVRYCVIPDGVQDFIVARKRQAPIGAQQASQ